MSVKNLFAISSRLNAIYHPIPITSLEKLTRTLSAFLFHLTFYTAYVKMQLVGNTKKQDR